MDSLVGYGSDEDHENERYEVHNKSSVSHSGGGRRRDDDTNYDDVNMDMSEDSQAESEPELPPAEPAPRADPRHDDGKHSRGRSKSRERSADKRDRRRDDRDRRDRDRPDKPDRYNRSERDRERRHDGGSSRRGLLGDRPDDRTDKIPPVVEARGSESAARSHDARDAVSPRFVDRERRDRERDRERERDRDRHARRSEEKRGGRERYSERSRSRSREARERRAAFPPPEPSVAAHSSGERRISPATTDYRPSYKVNRKLEVMEKMGLQIKTPDGSMATAQQLRQAACDAPPAASGGPSFFNTTGMHANKILDQVQKRKLLWSGKNKSEAEEAAKWSGTRFAQDNDGKQVSKFMRLMGIKEPAVVKPEAPDKTVDPIKKQEELFQAMQQQYEVARATTHTMRGVGLGFQRGQY